MNAEYPLTVLHSACYVFGQLQCFVGELESAEQGEAMLFLLKSNETISTWAYELF